MGAPVGNQNAAKSRQFYGALQRAIAQDDGKKLRAAAEKLLEMAEAGEGWAIRELADRLDGKAAQSMTLAGDPERPLVQRIENVIVDPAN
jgi:hypothetical protein